MAKETCECCGERAADRIAGKEAWPPEYQGALYSGECLFDHGCAGIEDRILARRRANPEQPSDTIPAPPYFLAEPTGPREFKLAPPPPPAAPECRECSRPERPIAATHGELCVYCEHKQDDGIFTDGVTEGRNAAARSRMAAVDRKAQPRATAENRMLALPHPWECDDV